MSSLFHSVRKWERIGGPKCGTSKQRGALAGATCVAQLRLPQRSFSSTAGGGSPPPNEIKKKVLFF
jgi:hypothetical protein